MTPTTIDETIIKLRAGLHTTLQANGLTLQDIDIGQNYSADLNYKDIYNTPFIPFETPQMVFNGFNTDWGQPLQPTQDIMQAYIALPREEEF